MNQPTINTEVDDAVIPPSSTVDPTKLVDDNDDAFPSDIAEDGPVATPHFHKEMVYRVAIMSSQTELDRLKEEGYRLDSCFFSDFPSTDNDRQRSRRK